MTRQLITSHRKRKLEVIQYYNRTKIGVDLMDQMVHTFTRKRQTQRCPMVLWHNLIDVAMLNAYTIFKAQHPGDLGGQNDTWRCFIKVLSKELVMPLIRKRADGCPKLQMSQFYVVRPLEGA
ncbi:hypothetical protein AAFF_G00374810 [Aldrovandia affinis]|uniref:PiggyBac transposable element-derived protein domain-containing protein n=1 Tax=Aldrovandia affinis TaxID=143900 RepID=A0AAD7SG18_9TELE|nr:hypothetical protein AAFF_G00374810 [Aldrovandia affinis]